MVGLATRSPVPGVGAEDLAQEAIMAAHRDWDRIGAYGDQTPGYAGLWRTCRSRRSDAARLKRRRWHACLWGSTQRCPSSRRGTPEFWAAIRGLPRRQAQVVALFYLEDRPRRRDRGDPRRDARDRRRHLLAGRQGWPGGCGRRRTCMTLGSRGRRAGGDFRRAIDDLETSAPDRGSIGRFERVRTRRLRNRRIGAGLVATTVTVATIAFVEGVRAGRPRDTGRSERAGRSDPVWRFGCERTTRRLVHGSNRRHRAPRPRPQRDVRGLVPGREQDPDHGRRGYRKRGTPFAPPSSTRTGRTFVRSTPRGTPI